MSTTHDVPKVYVTTAAFTAGLSEITQDPTVTGDLRKRFERLVSRGHDGSTAAEVLYDEAAASFKNSNRLVDNALLRMRQNVRVEEKRPRPAKVRRSVPPPPPPVIQPAESVPLAPPAPEQPQPRRTTLLNGEPTTPMSWSDLGIEQNTDETVVGTTSTSTVALADDTVPDLTGRDRSFVMWLTTLGLVVALATAWPFFAGRLFTSGDILLMSVGLLLTLIYLIALPAAVFFTAKRARAKRVKQQAITQVSTVHQTGDHE